MKLRLLFSALLSLHASAADSQRFDKIYISAFGPTLVLTSSIPWSLTNYYSLYPIETSTDLLTWTPWSTVFRTNAAPGPTQALDPSGTLPARFYRTPTNFLVTTLQQPGGQFTVGTTTRVFTDSSRSNRYGIKTNSSFVVQLWYPAQSAPGRLPAQYFEPGVAKIAGEFYSHFGLPGNPSIFTDVVSHAIADLHPLRGKFPVIIFSHGYQCFRTMDTDLLAHLASNGFLVAAADHFDAWVSILPGGRVVRGNAPDLPITVAQNIFNLTSRTLDVRFMLDQFVRLNSADDLLLGRFDLERIGILGHSLGGAIAADACAADKRLKAGVSLDGGGHTNLLGLPVTQPFLITLGQDNNEMMVPYRAAFRKFFDQLAHDAYFFRLANADHFDFVEQPWFMRSPETRRRRMALTLRAYVTSFFEKHLKGKDDRLLDAPSTSYPDVIDFATKR